MVHVRVCTAADGIIIILNITALNPLFIHVLIADPEWESIHSYYAQYSLHLQFSIHDRMNVVTVLHAMLHMPE